MILIQLGTGQHVSAKRQDSRSVMLSSSFDNDVGVRIRHHLLADSLRCITWSSETRKSKINHIYGSAIELRFVDEDNVRSWINWVIHGEQCYIQEEMFYNITCSYILAHSDTVSIFTGSLVWATETPTVAKTRLCTRSISMFVVTPTSTTLSLCWIGERFGVTRVIRTCLIGSTCVPRVMKPSSKQWNVLCWNLFLQVVWSSCDHRLLLFEGFQISYCMDSTAWYSVNAVVESLWTLEEASTVSQRWISAFGLWLLCRDKIQFKKMSAWTTCGLLDAPSDQFLLPVVTESPLSPAMVTYVTFQFGYEPRTLMWPWQVYPIHLF